jgi:dolichol kinase
MVLAVGFIVANIVNRFSHVVPFLHFHAINGVRRKSAGDILFGVGVLAVAWFEPSPWLFAAAMLQVSIADGLAALAGVTYGQKHGQYFLFGQPKSIIGSTIFLLSSMLILTSIFFADNYFADPLSMWPAIIMLPLMLVCLENMAVYGLDNIVLPLVTLGVLSLF